jgi:hypothetical protein
VINGKPKQRFSARKLQILAKEKGFSAAIPINNVKRQ